MIGARLLQNREGARGLRLELPSNPDLFDGSKIFATDGNLFAERCVQEAVLGLVGVWLLTGRAKSVCIFFGERP
jgi:hypothetical protein